MKILIVHAYAGIGHKKAAEAIRDALKGYKDMDVKCIDVLDYTTRFFKFSYPSTYLFLIDRVPFLWGYLYYFFDIRLVDIVLAPLRRIFHNLQAKRFVRFLLDEKPDVVLCTHFLPAEVVSDLKRKGLFSGRLITVVTDFISHAFWMARHSDYFIVAIDRTKKDLLKRGIPEDKIKAMGIPCESKFSVTKGRAGLIKELGLEKGFFNLLMMGGGFGTGPVRDIIHSLSRESRIRDTIQVVVICGKNKKLFDELDSARKFLKLRLKVFGFMNNIDEFMEVSDCIITKSGGLTVSEALSKKLPMIITSPIPGQETRNCNILTGFGTAVRADRVEDVIDRVSEFIDRPEKIIGMKARINLLSYPNAARDIVSFITNK